MLTQQPGYDVYEYSCHEGNTAVRSALSGERAYERRVAEAREQGLPIPERVSSTQNLQLPEDRDSVEFFDINAGE